MFRYNKGWMLLLVSLGVFLGIVLAAWSHGHGEQRHESNRTATTLENLNADLNPERLTFDDLNRLFGSTGQYNRIESPRGASKFAWEGVVEATFLGRLDEVKGSSTPVALGIGDDKFAGSVLGVRMGCSTEDLNSAALRFGVAPELVNSSFHVQVAPSWQVAGAIRGGKVVGWLSARRVPELY